MLKKLLLASAAAFLAAIPGLAWNRAGHMAMAAITYDELRREAPATIARVVAILRQHPQYESRWKPQIDGMSPEDQQRFLFMLAARWPDDIRGDSALDHPKWHYIDYPYKPPGQPASVLAPAPEAENMVAAFQNNVQIAQGTAPDEQKAIALCWIIHVLGDVHQPLHTAALFTTQFPAGDRGGNLIFIQAGASRPRTENLHAYWDNILPTDDRYGAASALARAFEARHPRLTLGELAEPHFEAWAQESFKLAGSTVYRKGKIQSGADRNHGAPLPRGYHAAAQRVAERRLVLSAYRLADFLRSNFP
ncbi:MAG TPA: S1/P1 nuclease [Bryobacteraceae bacterium]|nr:S1/P1 nuclease [Bryobacteraceae bacterium]